MPWSSSNRRQTLPRNWHTIRARVLHRDLNCQLGYTDVCQGRSVEVDHIGDPTDHRLENLRGVCSPCHKRRTGQQAAAARPRRKREPERHPGLM